MGKYVEILDASDWDAWCDKYIDPLLRKGEYELIVDEAAPSVLVFPLFSLAQTINSIEHYPSINLESGWNMIRYTCLDPMNVEDALLSLGDTVLIVKDNNGNVYLPEFNFNGIEQFEFGFGYQLKLSQEIFNFSF